MNNRRSFIYAIPVIGIIICILLFITNQLNASDFSDRWFSALSSVSTSFASLISVLLLAVTFFYLLATRDMVNEMRKQRMSQEEPAVSVRIVPDETHYGTMSSI